VIEKKIPYSMPSITANEVAYAKDAAEYGWGEKCYEYVDRFERLFAQHLGVKHAIATSSCTGAIHMGLSAIGIGPGDEVVMGDTNWIASAAPVTHLGAQPIFVDVDEYSWCLDPAKVEAAITPKTKAILAVHIYGNLCDLTALLEIGERHNIPVIEDAAEAVGSCHHDRRAGSIGLFGTFSFHGTKTITCGEGGMFVTNDTVLYNKVLTLNNHGRARNVEKQFWSEVIGFKFKMSNIQAALGCAQVERIDELISRKREIYHYYKNAFSGYSEIQINPEPDGMVNGAWMPSVMFSKDSQVTRDTLLESFKAVNIDARVVFWPLSSLGLFDSHGTENKVAKEIQNRSINLPSFHDMCHEDQDRVIRVIRSLLD
jgi:perosamine synthetase